MRSVPPWATQFSDAGLARAAVASAGDWGVACAAGSLVGSSVGVAVAAVQPAARASSSHSAQNTSRRFIELSPTAARFRRIARRQAFTISPPLT